MSWIIDAIGADRLAAARYEANRRRLQAVLGAPVTPELPDAELHAVGAALELEVFDLLADADVEALRAACVEAFQVLRALPRPVDPLEAATWALRVACLAVVGDRGADARRLLIEQGIPTLPLDAEDWGKRVWATTLDTWLRLLRKDGWDDLDRVRDNVVALRRAQREQEPGFLAGLDAGQDAGAAWQLVAEYHLAKSAEVLGFFAAQGEGLDGRFDVQQQLEAHFDRAIGAAGRGQLVELEALVRLLAKAADAQVRNSIWTVTRAVNSRVTHFVREAVARARRAPLFEMLPPQRRALREEGLLGSGHRSVVVSLPTSSGKTLIAQFRILQALNQFDVEGGWVAYVAPTRALVKQIAVRLRRDFEPLGIGVERVSPALEVDGLEAAMLTDARPAHQLRVLVTTPEKLDLLLRGGWEAKIGRPLTLVVVDEAHNLRDPSRGLKLELLLATINRECRYAQFLLLTPFIQNASTIARWLAPDSHQSVELALEWVPNDRVVALAEPVKAPGRGDFHVQLRPLHTTRHTLDVPNPLVLPAIRPLGLTWGDARTHRGALAAAAAQQLRGRGAVILLAGQVPHTWSLAKRFKVEANRRLTPSPEVEAAKAFLAEEFGGDFALGTLLDYGVAVHHSGMSDDARALVEWLTEAGHIDVLVATTTLAQGVNFPVSSVVLAAHQYPRGQEMPPEDFWNIAGRAGRVDQGDLGVIALAAPNAEVSQKLRGFVAAGVGALNSTLVDMVQEAATGGDLEALERLAWRPNWSAFLQYLVHTYRQLGDYDRFAVEVEQVLRGTLGFQALRRSDPRVATQLVGGVLKYGRRLAGKPLHLVDSTGFSLETVTNTLVRLSDARLGQDAWGDDLFSAPRPHLATMMGLLLKVPELRENLEDVLGGPSSDGDKLARIVCDWVQGRSLSEMAATHFPKQGPDGAPDPTASMTECCRRLFGRLTQTASWGLAALQALTFREGFDALPEAEQRALRNLPARVYYGVNDDAALALRLLGVPRQAAAPVARALGLTEHSTLAEARAALREGGEAPWTRALGELGPVYRQVWRVVEGA